MSSNKYEPTVIKIYPRERSIAKDGRIGLIAAEATSLLFVFFLLLAFLLGN